MNKRYFSGFPDTKDKDGAVKYEAIASDKDVIVTAHAQIPKPPEIHFETQKIEEAPEVPDIPDVEFLVLTSKEIKSKTDDELVAILSGEHQPDKALSLPTQSLITTELISRAVNKSNKPHWTVIPAFWMLAAGIVIGTVSLIIGFLSYFK